MDLKQFAQNAGVKIVECDKEWGGRIGYKSKDHPSCTIAGFRTEQSALRHWLKDTFGEHTAKAVVKLLKQAA